MLLLTHSHSAFELKTEFLIQTSHTAIGLLAVLMGCARWLELRLPSRAGRWAGLAAVVGLLWIGALLAIYREPAVFLEHDEPRGAERQQVQQRLRHDPEHVSGARDPARHEIRLPGIDVPGIGSA